MKDYSISETLFGTRSGIKVLRVLDGVSVPLSGRQIAQQAGITYQAVNATLGQLAEIGVVQVSRSGNARLYQLESNHILIQQLVKPLFRFEYSLRDDMIRDIREALSPLAESVVMFGSFARGDQTLSSDVDLVVVISDDGQKNAIETELNDFTALFNQRFGHRLEILLYTSGEAAAFRERSSSLLSEILDDGLVIVGNGDWMRDG